MTRRVPLALLPLLGLATLAAAASPASSGRAPTPAPAPVVGPRAGAMAPNHGGDTDCAACHTPEGWRPVAFNHDRTGFVLEGRHREVTCKACHRTSTFADPIPRACSACHRDVHLGRLGQRCQDCHDPSSFAARSFGPDAHRRTSFPLTGRHAAIACEECHGDRRDRGFNRPSPRCVGCHEADLARAAGAAVDHSAPGFPTDCRVCHSTWRFTPAGFPAHQACFDIRHGAHASVSCRGCHSTIPVVDISQPLTCASDTANCTGCHRHSNEAAAHASVLGFANVNRKCYECHRFAAGP